MTRAIGLLTVLLFGLALFQLTAGILTRMQSTGLSGTVVEPPEPMPAWSLQAHSGDVLQSAALHGRVQLLYFGYTSCPDICPITTAALALTVGELDDVERDQVHVMMVSVDPERDRAEDLKAYLAAFDPSFVGLRGDEAELAAVAKPLGAYYERVGAPGIANYRIDHTASVALIDREGRLRSLYPLGFSLESLRRDIRQLLGE